jgi:hypothetical protein
MKVQRMTGKFIRDFKHTAKADIRLFLAPYRGAWKGIRKEWACFETTTLAGVFKSTVRLCLAPFAGAFDAIKQEVKIK